MKIFFSITLTLIAIAGAIYANMIAASYEHTTLATVKESTEYTSVIANKYSDFTYDKDLVVNKIAEPPEPVEKTIEINKFEDKRTDDYLGAISIPSIGVEDSIYKSDGDYYLQHNYNKEYYEPGELYLDERTGESLTTNGALINGHAVKNGSKFGNFKDLLDVEEQPEVLVWDESLQETVKYRIMFVALIDGTNSGIVMNFPNDEARTQYYRNLHFSSIKKWEEPTGGEYLILNSCSYIIKNGRYVVFTIKENN